MDEELLTRLRQGDEEAFVSLVTRYQQPLTRFARSMVPSEAVAEEVVQDTWIGVIRGIDKFEGRSSLKTWLFRILANRARSTGSRERSWPLGATSATVDPARFNADGTWSEPPDRWPEESDERIDAARWSPFLRQALDALPERQRQVVLLRDVEGLSSEEACEILEVSLGNQRILLHRGRARLREQLDEEMRRQR